MTLMRAETVVREYWGKGGNEYWQRNKKRIRKSFVDQKEFRIPIKRKTTVNAKGRR